MNILCLPILALPLLSSAAPQEDEPKRNRTFEFDESSASASVVAGGRELDYSIVLRTTRVRDDEEEVTAHFTTFAYLLDGADPIERPVTFAFNGGPGSASIWLHLGLLGPRRAVVPSDAANAGAPPYPLVENPHTLLTHSDLVFVDPVGTGFSRASGESTDEDFWGVDEDVASVANFVRQWLTDNGRWGSPKYVLGESYGGIRGALLAESLKSQGASVALNGLIFVSPAFDIQFVDGREDDLTYVTELPTYAATAHYHGVLPQPVADRDAWLEEVRDFASGPYLEALFAGSALPADQRRAVAEQLHAYTGISADHWERANLRLAAARFLKELLRERGLVLGRLDTRYRGREIDAAGETPQSDPMIDGIGSAYTAAFMHYLRRDIGLELPRKRQYQVFGNGTFGKWKRSAEGQEAFSGWLDTVPALARSMQSNPELRVFCANGWFDVATTVMAAEYNLSRPGIDPARVVIENYEAGHMMYVHEPSLERLAADLRAFYSPQR